MTRTDLINAINAEVQRYVKDRNVTEAGLSVKSKAQLEARLEQLRSANAANEEAEALYAKYTRNQWHAASMGYADSGVTLEDRRMYYYLINKATYLWWHNTLQDAERKAQAEAQQVK